MRFIVSVCSHYNSCNSFLLSAYYLLKRGTYLIFMRSGTPIRL
jgi:hypothetical protein